MFGVGLAVAVLLDVTLVRMVLVPAAMSLLGHRAWWLPAWLDRRLPRIDLEGGAARRGGACRAASSPTGPGPGPACEPGLDQEPRAAGPPGSGRTWRLGVAAARVIPYARAWGLSASCWPTTTSWCGRESRSCSPRSTTSSSSTAWATRRRCWRRSPRHRPDAVLTDIRMPPTHTTEGIEAAKQIRTDHPDDRRRRPLAVRRGGLRLRAPGRRRRGARLPPEGARVSTSTSSSAPCRTSRAAAPPSTRRSSRG